MGTQIPLDNAGALATADTMHAALACSNVSMIEAPFANSAPGPETASPYPKFETGYALQPRLNAPDGSARNF